MKKLNFLFLLTLGLGVVFFNSCKDDDEETTPNAPTVSVSSSSTEVVSGETVEISFTVSVPGGFASSSVSATGGSASITTDMDDEATSGTIVVEFTAGDDEGAGSVVLTVTDSYSQSDDATAVVTVSAEVTEISVSSDITSDETWYTGKTYILESRIAVTSGATLTIQPGVVVKGQTGSGSNATCLIIAQGSKIDAQGEADSPIIFTAYADNIEPGEIESPNMDSTLTGLWGGLIILGYAPISADAETAQIEGIPASDSNGLYGGSDSTDNSGTLKYVSIRHGGTNIGEGNEINGLTLGGVGSGTTIENVEIVANQDDGIEFFGGAVKVKNVVVWNNGDDALDTDQAFAGSISNFLIINPGDKCFELDGPEGSYEGPGHTIANGTVLVGDAVGLIDFDDNTDVYMKNIYFTDLASAGGQVVEGYAGYLTNTNGFSCSDFEVTLPTGIALTDVFVDGSDAITTAVAEGANTVGADTSVFDGWTWVSAAGAY